MKKILVPFTLFFVVAAATVMDGCQSAKNATSAKMLKFALEKGKGYDYEMSMNLDQEIMGQPVKMNMSTYYSMDVQNDAGGIKTIVTSFDRLKMQTDLMGMNINVDTDVTTPSDSLDKNPLAAMSKVFGAIKGQRFTMQVNEEGKITEITGFENMAQHIADSLGLNAEDRREMVQGFNSQFNAEEIKQNFERFWYIFPNKEVKVGDSWEKKSAIKGKMAGTYTSRYKVTDIEGDMVTLEEVTKIDSKEGERISLTGEIKGIVVVDSRTGLLMNADQDMDMKASGEGMSFNIKGKSKIKGKAR